MKHWFQQSWCNMVGDLKLYDSKIKTAASFLSETGLKIKLIDMKCCQMKRFLFFTATTKKLANEQCTQNCCT